MIVKIDVEFSTEIFVLRSPEPKKWLKMPVYKCTSHVIAVFAVVV